MNATREELLQNLTYVQQTLGKMQTVFTKYVQLERNFRSTQAGIETGGVANRAKLAAITVGCTLLAFILLIAVLSGGYVGIVMFAVAAIIIVVNKNKKSKAKNIAIFFIALSLLTTLWAVIESMSIGIMLILLVLLAIIVSIEWFFITAKNKSVAEYNKKVEANNQAVQAQRDALYSQYQALLKEMTSNSSSWFPPDYYNIEAVNFFVSVVKNYRAETVKDMVNLFEESTYHKQMLAYQQHQSQQINQLIAGQQEITGQLRYANMINTAALFQLQSINSGVQKLHTDTRNIHGAIGGVQGAVGRLSSEVSEIKNKIK